MTKRIFIFLVFWIITSPGFAEDVIRNIDVSGEGTISAAPDMATISTGVVSKASNANDAVSANTKAMNNIVSVLRENGVDEKDQQTSNYSVQPEYRYFNNNEQPPKIIGYAVSNQLTIKVRDLESLGKVLDALVRAGSNQTSGIRFGFSKPETITNRARKAAIKNAFERAQLYAEEAGVSVGKVISIRELNVRSPVPLRTMRGKVAMAAEAMADVPVAAGESEVSATIHVSFEIAD